MICMCEVGVVGKPLHQEQMRQMATECTQAWENAATEHVNLRSLFEVGQPYMTIYNHGPITCSCHRILGNLYHVEGQPRTAQTVLCCGPGGVTVDVIKEMQAPEALPNTKVTKHLSTIQGLVPISLDCWLKFLAPPSVGKVG